VYHEKVSYEVDSGMVVFDPKQTGAAPIFQQVRNPKLKCIQSGYAKQVGMNATDVAPPPAPVLSNAVMLWSSVTPMNPEPIGGTPTDGTTWYLYGFSWTYTMAFNGKPPSSTTGWGMKFPNDPRVTPDNGGAIPNMPKITQVGKTPV
jgi:hypothetical protein